MKDSTNEVKLKNLFSRFQDLLSENIGDIMMSGWDAIILSDGKSSLFNVETVFICENDYHNFIHEMMKLFDIDKSVNIFSADYDDFRVTVSKIDKTYAMSIRRFEI